MFGGRRPVARGATLRTAGRIDGRSYQGGRLVRRQAEVGHYAAYAIVEFEEASWGDERDQPGNFLGSVNQRKREFGPEILGSERNLEGPSRTPKNLLRTRESDDAPGLDVNCCGKGGKRETPGGRPLGVRR